ncbi:MAG: hypothetical protein ACJ8GJ_10975 [Vitreoscilla sp.]
MDMPMRLFRVQPRSMRPPRRQAQRGVIMVLTLVALVLLLIGVAAMVRSTDTSTAVIGNLAFRRDLTNRGETAIATAKAALNTGSLSTLANRNSNLATANYSATRLPNAKGIGVPAVLINDTAYSAATYSCLPASCLPDSQGVVIRWVIDRQCSASSGTTSMPFSNAACAYLSAGTSPSGPAQDNANRTKGMDRALYRISVRVSGPHNTESYIQSTAG